MTLIPTYPLEQCGRDLEFTLRSGRPLGSFKFLSSRNGNKLGVRMQGNTDIKSTETK